MQKTNAPIVAVVGGGLCSPQEAAIAERVGRCLAEAGAILICGGGGGVMAAACRENRRRVAWLQRGRRQSLR
jgi:uncharacterized protein (TIGR00725 family)